MMFVSLVSGLMKSLSNEAASSAKSGEL